MARVNLGQMYAEVAGRTALWDRPSTCGSLALQACEPPCVCQYAISDSYCWFKSSNLIFTCCCTILLISFFPVSLLKRPTKLYKTLHSKTVTSCHMLISEPGHVMRKTSPGWPFRDQEQPRNWLQWSGPAKECWRKLTKPQAKAYDDLWIYHCLSWSIMIYHHGLSSWSIMTHHDPWWSIMIYLSVHLSIYVSGWLVVLGVCI